MTWRSGRYFTPSALAEKVGTRGEPFDITFDPWGADYSDASTYFQPLLNGNNLTAIGNTNWAYFDVPRYNREIDRIDRLSGVARRRAWANLDVDMMRNDPPWAPFMNATQDDFVSRSFGCYVFQSAIGSLDIAAACKR